MNATQRIGPTNRDRSLARGPLLRGPELKLADVARIWQQADVSVVPILANQTKRPAVRWAEYQAHAPTLGQVDEWWGNGKSYGLALICGAVSGNLEMTEIEGRACGGDHLTEIMNQMDELGLGHIWDLLTGPNGYSEMSPSGGLHLLYRISDHEVPGNTKIAQDPDRQVLAETRGTGGYVIVAPTPGLCHPSGEAWTILQGAYGSLPVITWEDRCRLHEALRRALDFSLPTAPIHPGSDAPRPTGSTPFDLSAHYDSARNGSDDPVQVTSPITPDASTHVPHSTLPTPLPPSPRTLNGTGAGLSPGDHYEAVTDWAEILEPHGWKYVGMSGGERLWRRPGKTDDGHSATTGYKDDRDRLWVFSTSTLFQHETSYTKFAAYTELNFGGNYQMAAAELSRRGFGTRSDELDVFHPTPPSAPAAEPSFELSDVGNAQRLMKRIQGTFHYLNEEKTVIHWNGLKWVPDKTGALMREYVLMMHDELAKARRRGDEVQEKYWVRCGNMPRINGSLGALHAEPGFQISTAELNRDRHLVGVENGMYDLKTHELKPVEQDRLMTRSLGTVYDPNATCPEFEGFMAKVLPEPQMRSYVQRALGYSLLGDADQRSLFLICGPSGTGKSTLMATMELLFGEYGTTAPSGTLRATGRESSTPSNDLHTLMGKRFVSTSETNEHTAYNEDLIKRLTGRDKISSRRLYQEFQEWSPRCTIWLATNHPPRFSSDDDAIWRRAKIVPFHTVLLDENEIPDFAHNVLANELPGIFNWLLAGLKQYQAHGLQEPDSVKEMIREVRLQSDPVSRFMEDRISEGMLVQGEGARVRTTQLYAMYAEWAKLVGERALGNRRFINRMMSAFPDLAQVKSNGYYFWQGIGRPTEIGANWVIQGALGA
jgi:putative DNA primase/helicase